MAGTQIHTLARNFPVEINTGTSETPVWTRIESLETVTFNVSKTDAETNNFDNAGWTSHIVAMRGLEITVAGQVSLDPVTKSPSPGQAAVEALGRAVDQDAFKEFRVRRPGGKAVAFTASAMCNPTGGGTNEAAKWTATLKSNGEPAFDVTVTP